jgi:hypothetical protein
MIFKIVLGCVYLKSHHVVHATDRRPTHEVIECHVVQHARGRELRLPVRDRKGVIGRVHFGNEPHAGMVHTDHMPIWSVLLELSCRSGAMCVAGEPTAGRRRETGPS